jgi:hypothetical protein
MRKFFPDALRNGARRKFLEPEIQRRNDVVTIGLIEEACPVSRRSKELSESGPRFTGLSRINCREQDSILSIEGGSEDWISRERHISDNSKPIAQLSLT